MIHCPSDQVIDVWNWTRVLSKLRVYPREVCFFLEVGCMCLSVWFIWDNIFFVLSVDNPRWSAGQGVILNGSDPYHPCGHRPSALLPPEPVPRVCPLSLDL